MSAKFQSRKFIVVLLILFTTIILALVSKLTGEASSVLTALAVVYPPSQAYIDGKND